MTKDTSCFFKRLFQNQYFLERLIRKKREKIYFFKIKNQRDDKSEDSSDTENRDSINNSLDKCENKLTVKQNLTN